MLACASARECPPSRLVEQPGPKKVKGLRLAGASHASPTSHAALRFVGQALRIR